MRAALPCTALLATAWIAIQPSAAQDFGVDSVPFPANPTSERAVQAWINRYLPTRGYAIGAWSANVVMLVSVDGLKAEDYPQVTTDVLTETLSAKAANAAGWRAALQTMAFDCSNGRYRTVSSLYFARGDRKGGFDQDGGSTVWLTPEEGATLDTVERAACFQGRLKHEAKLAASAQPLPDTVQAQPAPAKLHHAHRRKRHHAVTATVAPTPSASQPSPVRRARLAEVTPQLHSLKRR